MVGVFKMVEGKREALQSIQSKIDSLPEEKGRTEECPISRIPDVVLFFSFDIVNSTAYKTINYYGWAQVLNLLFKELREEVGNKIKSSEMWRVLGDEAIFIIKIRDEDELCEYVSQIFQIMVSTIHRLKKGEFFNFSNNFNKMKLQNILSLKTAAWLAAVTDVGDIESEDILLENADNIFERYQSPEGHDIFEFLGNDIDTGFRIARYTEEGRMVLSYELAYLIAQKTGSLSCLHIITYRRLKGIWNDKLYPIIWYHAPNAYCDVYEKEIELQNSFTFDACDESELIKEYYDNRQPNKEEKIIRDMEMYSNPLYALNKILWDRELTEKIERLQKLIREATYDQTRFINTELMQVHCVAVCFKTIGEEIKILVAKRTDRREKHKGAWEFGCAKAVIDKSIAQKIKEEYKQDFNIEIEPVLDNTREIKEPVPIALYQIAHGFQLIDAEKKDKGIITLARIIGEYDPKDFKPNDKHEKVKWITEAELEDIDKNYLNKVPDFEQTLRQAFDKIKTLSDN